MVYSLSNDGVNPIGAKAKVASKEIIVTVLNLNGIINKDIWGNYYVRRF
jgi:hypothetical protein